MTDIPLSIPPAVIDKWVRTHCISTLSSSEESVATPPYETDLDTFNYSLLVQKVRKAQGEIMASIFRTLVRITRSFLHYRARNYLITLHFQLSKIVRRCRALRELSSLSPGILRDIGLSQGGLSAVEHGQIKLSDLNDIRHHGRRY